MAPVHGIPPIETPSPPQAPARVSFADLLGGSRVAAGDGHPTLVPGGPKPANSGGPSVPVVRALDRVRVAQARMDAVLRLAASGRSFTPAELLALQAGVAQASQVLDLSGRLVERASAAVKQVLQTQI